MSTINRICILQGWTTEKLVQLAVEYLESEGRLHDFLDWLQAVAQDENERDYENIACHFCHSAIDSHGFCTNPECDFYGFVNEEVGGMHVIQKQNNRSDAMSRTNEFEGATCSACDSSLDRSGYCTNECCGFADYHQDEPGGWVRNQEPRPRALKRFEAGCVVANKRSRRHYLSGDKAYLKASKAKLATFFKTEDDAVAMGYRRIAH